MVETLRRYIRAGWWELVGRGSGMCGLNVLEPPMPRKQLKTA